MTKLMIGKIEPLVLEWAAEHHPEKHAASIAVRETAIELRRQHVDEIRVKEKGELATQVMKKFATYQNFLLRLVEIRCEEDKAWIEKAPAEVLDETKVVANLRDRHTGRMLRFAGKRVTPREPDMHPFSVLLMERSDFELLMAAWETLDLEYIVEESNGRTR